MVLSEFWGMAWAFIRSGYRRQSAYLAATIAGVATNSVFGLVKASIVVAAVGAAGGSLAGYNRDQALGYAWLTQGIIASVYVFIWPDLAQRVRTGAIAIDLARPVDLQLSWLAADLGRAAYVLIPRGVPPMVIGWLIFRFHLSTSPMVYLVGAVSVVLAVVVSFLWRYLVSLSAFWLIDVRGVLGLATFVGTLLNGLAIPVAWFPQWLRTIAWCTPFPSLIQVPADLLTGRVEGGAALGLLAVQVGWVVVLVGIGRFVLVRATRHLVVQGG